MPIIRTNRSRLFDRTVRVERRRRLNDGMYGAVPSYSTLIDRFFCSIFPYQHQERRAIDIGEADVTQTRNAIGNPQRNGVTIMIGDRFVDDTNNETYDVLAVVRPKGHPYNAMHSFVLRIVRDAPVTGS